MVFRGVPEFVLKGSTRGWTCRGWMRVQAWMSGRTRDAVNAGSWLSQAVAVSGETCRRIHEDTQARSRINAHPAFWKTSLVVDGIDSSSGSNVLSMSARILLVSRHRSRRGMVAVAGGGVATGMLAPGPDSRKQTGSGPIRSHSLWTRWFAKTLLAWGLVDFVSTTGRFFDGRLEYLPGLLRQ